MSFEKERQKYLNSNKKDSDMNDVESSNIIEVSKAVGSEMIAESIDALNQTLQETNNQLFKIWDVLAFIADNR